MATSLKAKGQKAKQQYIPKARGLFEKLLSYFAYLLGAFVGTAQGTYKGASPLVDSYKKTLLHYVHASKDKAVGQAKAASSKAKDGEGDITAELKAAEKKVRASAAEKIEVGKQVAKDAAKTTEKKAHQVSHKTANHHSHK